METTRAGKGLVNLVVLETRNPDPQVLPSLGLWQCGNEVGTRMHYVSATFPGVPEFTCDFWCYESGLEFLGATALDGGRLELRHRESRRPQVHLVTTVAPEPGVVEFRARARLAPGAEASLPADLPVPNLCWQLKRAPGFASKPDLYPEFVGRCFMFTETGLTFLNATRRRPASGVPPEDPRSNPPWVQAYLPSWAEGSGDRFTHPVIGAVSRDRRYLAAIACERPEFFSQYWHDCMHNNPAWLPVEAGPAEQSWRVRIYAMENDPEQLLRRVVQDFPSLCEPREESGGPRHPARPPEQTVRLPGGATMDLVWVDSGAFAMGSPETEAGRNPDEGPRRQVTITSGFYLGKYPITQGQWHSVMGTRPWAGGPCVGSDPETPAVCVSWDEVNAFVRRLNEEMGGSPFRLPTEAEWEYACRAGTASRWSFPADEGSAEDRAWDFWSAEPRLGEYGWYFWNTWNEGMHQAQPVGKKLPNPWGLHDMHGNVWEWCQDWFGAYAEGDDADPTGPASGSSRVLRGGDFSRGAPDARSAARAAHLPAARSSLIGARILRRR